MEGGWRSGGVKCFRGKLRDGFVFLKMTTSTLQLYTSRRCCAMMNTEPLHLPAVLRQSHNVAVHREDEKSNLRA